MKTFCLWTIKITSLNVDHFRFIVMFRVSWIPFHMFSAIFFFHSRHFLWLFRTNFTACNIPVIRSKEYYSIHSWKKLLVCCYNPCYSRLVPGILVGDSGSDFRLDPSNSELKACYRQCCICIYKLNLHISKHKQYIHRWCICKENNHKQVRGFVRLVPWICAWRAKICGFLKNLSARLQHVKNIILWFEELSRVAYM